MDFTTQLGTEGTGEKGQSNQPLQMIEAQCAALSVPTCVATCAPPCVVSSMHWADRVVAQVLDYVGAGASLRMALVATTSEWNLTARETTRVWALVQARLGVTALGPTRLTTRAATEG